jgi:DNA polymerase III alpha subunit
MKYDDFGRVSVSESELCDILYSNPQTDLSCFLVDDPEAFNTSNERTHYGLPALQKYQKINQAIETFDLDNQEEWSMPQSYYEFDIAKWVLDRCNSEPELQRAASELLLFQEKNLFPLLKYLKYLVDTMRENNIVWGVGRGSSVASFVLYLIGVHKINSLYYDLPINEFFKD